MNTTTGFIRYEDSAFARYEQAGPAACPLAAPASKGDEVCPRCSHKNSLHPNFGGTK